MEGYIVDSHDPAFSVSQQNQTWTSAYKNLGLPYPDSYWELQLMRYWNEKQAHGYFKFSSRLV